MKKKIAVVALVLVVAAAAVWLLSRGKEKNQEKYTFTQVEKGDLEAVVSSTGTLSAVTTVQVGTQVSGRIARLYTDFNQRVKQGQLVAQLDTSSLQMAVTEAEANFDRARAQLSQSKQDLQRIDLLYKENIKTKNDLEQAQINLETSQASYKSAKSNLERARINLAYASIYAPIDGVVIARSVDVGQTVAASFSAPVLFLIANDLSKMQILANVDEGDIGQIKDGQNVRFTVQAYPDRKFKGVVNQIRMQPTTIQNVVNYTVVVNVDNSDGLLMPGMTATLDFLVGEAREVFKVYSSALRFKPNEEMMAVMRERFEKMRGAAGKTNGSSGGGQAGGGFSARGNGGEGHQRPKDAGLLWFLDESGKLDFVRVRTGLSDGQYTAVYSDKLKEGMKVIRSIVETVTGPGGSPMGGGPRMRMF